ncbi:MAG: GNAT family N-acetyltransferase [Acidobacteriota bacterium]
MFVFKADRLTGFGRVIGDGVHLALIADLIVHTDFRVRGIGKEILGKLVNRCRQENIRDIQLFAAEGNSSFCEKCDFKQRDIIAPGIEYM